MKKLYLYFGRFITACTLVFVFLSFLFSTYFVNKRSLILSGSPNITMLIQTALAFVLLGAAFFIFKIINNLNEKGQKLLTIGLFAVFLAVGITVCLSYCVVQTTDSYRCIDTAISFLTDKNGDEPVELFTWGSAFLMPELAEFGDVDTAIVSVKMKSGAIANINATRFANYGYDQRAEVLGTKGSLESRNDTPTNVILQNERGVIGDKPFYTFLDRYENAYAEEIKQFVESIINDKDVPVNAQDCLPALKMALVANISLKENRIVKIDEIK